MPRAGEAALRCACTARNAAAGGALALLAGFVLGRLAGPWPADAGDGGKGHSRPVAARAPSWEQRGVARKWHATTALRGARPFSTPPPVPLRGGERDRPTITVYIEPAKTRSTLFLTGRLVRYSSGKYRYRRVILNRKLARNATAFRYQTCVADPGFKLFVGHGELVHRNWPGNCVWSVTGDEAGDWGLKRNGKYYGLHGPGGLFPTNESDPDGPILVPAPRRPWFRQYYHTRQQRVFGQGIRYLPLGSRLEFPDIDPSSHRPAAERTYVYAYMVGLTDPSRKRLHQVLLADTVVPAEKAYVHVSGSWHPSANHEEYVAPAKYAEVMQDSVFALCPKGHSVEQFRLYEAIEAGAIPVLEDTAVTRASLPPEYFASGMLFVSSWESAPREMAALAQKQTINRRQSDLLSWYHNFMRAKLREIELVFEANPTPAAETVCAGGAGAA